MESKTKELVKAGHELVVLLGNQYRMIDAASLVQRLTAQLDITAAALREKSKQCDQLAAECSSIQNFLRNGPVINKGGELLAAHQFAPSAPATDAWQREQIKKAIPEGYALVPQEMCLSAEAMEAICFHCGDGGFAFGEFTDGVLFVGDSEPEEGKKVHGLHIVTADYPEEGCAVICEFLPALRNGEAV